ncbi:MAG: acyl-CoA dehydrogenase family protein [Kiritimatiellae bacterium]|nr:acyl-CoA dehydrogenase family protein [Kiritimatiellia bacterium]
MNFFTDNADIRFLLDHLDMARIADLAEHGFRFRGDFDFAPKDADDALDNYRRVLDLVGDLAANRLGPTAADTDRAGSILNPDGTVTYAPGISEAIRLFSQAGLMGFTLPYRYGGLNLPVTVYTAATEIVSRADASFMNIFGLQGIAETINAFAADDLKEQYLPRLASGELTGAMVLTEPDAGSDLQSVKTRAWQDETGNWFVSGVKRFITNGCGDVLVVLARTEPAIADGRGLSCLLVEKGPRVKVRRLEDKLGIHGSPTCEIVFDDAPAKLIGQRQRGLITYVMALMNAARLGIAAQSLGIGEAALCAAREYAAARKQFGATIDTFPAIRELLADMSVELQAARALTYYAASCVDLERGYDARLAEEGKGAPDAATWRQESRRCKGFNKMLTPMAKYFSSEMSMRLANGAVAVLGGSGYMRDYPVERLLRDSRITTIYEGTSQLQVSAAVSGVMSGTLAEAVESVLGGREWSEDLAKRVATVREVLALCDEAVAFVKAHPEGARYRDLSARKLVDMGVVALCGALLCAQGATSDTKLKVLDRWLATGKARVRALHELTLSGDTSVFEIDAHS